MQLYGLCDKESADVHYFLVSLIVYIGDVLHQFDEDFAVLWLQVANFSRHVQDFVLSFVVVWRGLDKEVLVRLLNSVQPVVSKGRKVV